MPNQEGDHFALIELPSGEERLEPLLDVHLRGLAILLRTLRVKLHPGMSVPRVRIFADGECTLDIRAHVRSVTQVSLETGGVGLRVDLEIEGVTGGAQPGTSVEQTTSEEAIARAVSDLVNARAQVQVLRENHTWSDEMPQGHLLHSHPDRRALEVYARESMILSAGHLYDLHVELLGTRMTLTCPFKETLESTWLFGWPQRLTLWRQRQSKRVRTLPPSLMAEFETPLRREVRRRPLIDVAARGVAFVAEPDDRLMLGMVLPRVLVTLPRGAVSARGVVRNIRHDSRNRLLVGVELSRLSATDEEALEAFVVASIHPRVRVPHAEDLRQLWGLYGRLGVFNRAEAPAKLLPRMESARATLLQRGRDVYVGLVAGAEDHLEGATEALLLYPETWSVRFARALDGSRLTLEQLLMPLIDQLMRPTDLQFLHMAVAPNPAGPGAEALGSLDPEQITSRVWEVLVPGPRYQRPATQPAEASDADRDNLAWIDTKAAGVTHPLEHRAFALNARDLPLDGVQKRYHGAGLERRRRVRLAMSISGPLGFALVEDTTPGVLLDTIGPVCRVFPTSASPQNRVSAAVTLAHDAVDLADTSAQVQIWVPEDLRPALEAEGFEHRGNRVDTVISRAAAPQLVNVLTILGAT